MSYTLFVHMLSEEPFIAEIEELMTAGLDGRFSFAGRLATQYGRNRDSVVTTLKLWLDWWRDLLLARAGCADLITNVDRKETVTAFADRYSLSEIRSVIEAVRTALGQLEQNANARLVLEVLMLSIPNKGERIKQAGA